MAIDVPEGKLLPSFSTLQRESLKKLANVIEEQTINDIVADPSQLQIELDDIVDVAAPSPVLGDTIEFDGTDWANQPIFDFITAGTAARDVTPSDNRAILVSGAGIGTQTLTITKNAAWPDGALFSVVQTGLFQSIIAAGANVSILYPSDKLPRTRGQNSVIHARRISNAATDEWVLYGDLADAP